MNARISLAVCLLLIGVMQAFADTRTYYKKVTDMTEVVAGQIYAFIYVPQNAGASKATFGRALAGFIEGDGGSGIEIGMEDDMPYATEGGDFPVEFVAESVDNGWKFKCNDQYLTGSNRGLSMSDEGTVWTINDDFSVSYEKYTLRYNSQVKSEGKFRCYKTKTGMVVPLYYKYKVEETETVTMTREGGFTTYTTVADIDMKATLAKNDETVDVHAYKVVEFNDDALVLQELGLDTDESEAYIPAGTPLVIKGNATENDLIVLNDATETPTISGNLLYSSDGTVTGTDDPVLYVMQSQEKEGEGFNYYGGREYAFYKLRTGRTIPEGKAYLSSKDMTQGNLQRQNAPAKGTYVIGSDATSISLLQTASPVSGIIFDLQGRRVSHPQRGLYIVDGKKLFVK